MDPIRDFMRFNHEMFVQLSEEQLDKLHRILFKILKDVVYFCEKNGLIYYLGGGTSLGAVRHHGFIPWDDDVDLAMPRRDFNIFREQFQNAHPDLYLVEAPNTDQVGTFAYMKVKMNGTILRELIEDEKSPEVFIDIFPIEYAPKSKLKRNFQGWYFTLLRDISYTILYSSQFKKVIEPHIKTCPFKTRLELRGGYILGRILGIIPQYKWINHLDKIAQKNPESNFVVIPTGLHNYRNELFFAEDYFPPQKGIFEGIEMNLPNHIEKILEVFYGNYMQLPPVDERGGHFFLEVNLPDLDEGDIL